jgi:sulfur carrier protein
MEVLINNKHFIIIDDSSLKSCLTQANIEIISGMAIAVNDTVIPANKWDDFKLNVNDNILIIRATQGG